MKGRIVAPLGLLLGVTCTDSRLEFIQPDVPDVLLSDELTLEGQFCTSPAVDLPYPVKIMFIIDGSGSQQFTDQNRQRVVAVEETINALIGAPNTAFKVLVFNASISATPPLNTGEVFSNSLSVLQPALTDLAEADTLTDYQGVLATAYSELLRDMTDVLQSPDPLRGQAELSRTKYVVVFISDGLPDPQCQAGLGNDFLVLPAGPNPLCENQDFLNCLLQEPGTNCTGGVCDFNGTLCFDNPEAATLFGGLNNTELAAGNDYNQPYQILSKVADIMDLQERFEVGEIRMHAGVVLDPLADPGVIDLFGDPAAAVPLMEQVAEIGQGKFLEFYGGDSIDFLQLNFDSLKQNRVVRGFFANNISTRMGATGLVFDSDGDGLSDAEEFELGTNALLPDSDDDGYQDLLEVRRLGTSFDPLDPCLPPLVRAVGAPATATCGPAVPPDQLRTTVNCEYTVAFDNDLNRQVKRFDDDDFDGVNDCEESLLDTNDTSPDTDADGIPDLVDHISGLDPARWDYDRDEDQDAVPNGQEIAWHLNPIIQQTPTLQRERYRYQRDRVADSLDGRACYDFEVRNVTLGATATPAYHAVGLGTNEVHLYISENLSDDLSGTPLYRKACVRVRYVPPSFKSPVCGRIRLNESDFKYLATQDPILTQIDPVNDLFDPTRHCISVWVDPYNCDATGNCFCTTGARQACSDPLRVGDTNVESCCQRCEL